MESQKIRELQSASDGVSFFRRIPHDGDTVLRNRNRSLQGCPSLRSDEGTKAAGTVRRNSAGIMKACRVGEHL